MKRSLVYHTHKKFAQHKDVRSMDAICSASTGFQLQVQQEFLKEYITKNPQWDKLLLYHQIGSGKTCTAITLAEQYTKMHPNTKVTVVLPARLRTNFFDELISPCGMEKYVSNEDFQAYYAPTTSDYKKASIRRKFMAAILEKYDIMSYEKFRAGAVKSGMLSRWVREATKDRLIIIDEVHNLISDTYESKKYTQIEADDRLSKSKGINTILFRYLTSHAHPSCKMIFLTATPVFDNIGQFKELVRALNPSAVFKVNAKISDLIGQIRGKVSFFPGTSANAYPSVTFQEHDIALSKTQDVVTKTIQDALAEEDNPDKEAFKMDQRQAAIATLPSKQRVSTPGNMKRVIDNLKEYAPKVLDLVQTIEKLPGKHVVYSTFIGVGLDIVEAALRQKGWVDFAEIKGDKDAMDMHANKIFAKWNGSVKDENKVLIKGVVNSVQNMDGKHIRVVLGSPSIKEGVSFKHVQHLHLLDPVWNSSAKMQIEGRAIRFCSHVDIPKNHRILKRSVVVHIYKSVPRVGGLVVLTADQELLDHIIPSKEKIITAAESALKKVSIDYYLFRRMYRKEPLSKLPSPPKPIGKLKRSDSLVSIDEDIPMARRAFRVKGERNTCPKKRRPNEDGQCPEGHYKKLNAQSKECCYKVRKSRSQAKPKDPKQVCPAGRQPIEGQCPTGFKVKQNKHGVECCFKVYKRKDNSTSTSA
jgi:hypothetical protein